MVNIHEKVNTMEIKCILSLYPKDKRSMAIYEIKTGKQIFYAMYGESFTHWNIC